MMKALERGDRDSELQQLMAQVRRDNGYADILCSEWPPDPDFREGADAEPAQTNTARLDALAGRIADQGAVPLALLELEQIGADMDSAASITGSAEDSLSNDYEKQHALPPPPSAAGCTRLLRTIPEPLASEPMVEDSVISSESSDAARSSELKETAARYPEQAAEDRLKTDYEFQQKLSRWRAGLPNFERQRPAQSTPAGDEADADSGYEYMYSRDEAAEGLGPEEGDEGSAAALDASFR